MKSSVGLVAIMAGLAMANPLAASTKTARGYITSDEFKYLRVALVSCLEANVCFSLLARESASTATRH